MASTLSSSGGTQVAQEVEVVAHYVDVLCSVQYSTSTEKLLVPPRSGDSLALTHLLDNGLDSDISFRLGGGAR